MHASPAMQIILSKMGVGHRSEDFLFVILIFYVGKQVSCEERNRYQAIVSVNISMISLKVVIIMCILIKQTEKLVKCRMTTFIC